MGRMGGHGLALEGCSLDQIALRCLRLTRFAQREECRTVIETRSPRCMDIG